MNHLLRAALHTGQPLRVRVTSGSMRPLLRAGDFVLVQPCPPETVHPGEVLTVHSGEGWLTHRLMEITPQGWILMGDAAPWADAPLPPESLVGRVRGVWSGEAFHDWEQPPWREQAQRAARLSRQRYALVRLLQKGKYPPDGASALLLRLWLRAFRLLW